MGRFLSGLQVKAVNPTAPRSTPVTRASSQSNSRYGKYSIYSDWDTEKSISQGFNKVLWVYRCVDKIASAQAGLNMFHKRGVGRFAEHVHNPTVDRLLNIRPNNYETAWQFKYRISALGLLTVRGVFIEIVGDPQNPDSLHILPPGSVEPIPHPVTFVSGYKVRDAHGEHELKPEQVIWIRMKPDPNDPYRQTNPLMTAGIAAQTDYLARVFNLNYMMNDGRPGLLVTVKGQISDEDAAEIKRRFEGGPNQAGRTTVIEGEGMDVVDMSTTPRDAQWMEVSNKSKEDILLAFGVPLSIMGDASGRTFANADAEYEIFWTHTMLDHCKPIAAAFDVLTGNLNDWDQIAHDFEDVDVLQRHIRELEDKIIERWQAGVITWNEMRKALGLPQWDTLAANIIVLPSGIAMAQNPADNAKIMELPNVGSPAPPPGQLESIARRGATRGAIEGSAQAQATLANRALMAAGLKEDTIVSEKKSEVGGGGNPFLPEPSGTDVVDAVIVNPQEEERKQLEDLCETMLMQFSARQEQVVADRLDHVKSRKGTRHWEQKDVPRTSLRAIDENYAVEVDRWAAEMRASFEKTLRQIMRAEARAASKDANVLIPQPVLDRATEQPLQELLDKVEKSVRNQSLRIAKQIRKMDDAGESLPAMQGAVRKLTGNRSQWHKALSMNLSNAAYEAARYEVYSKAGKRIKKTWNAQEDERVRDSHWHADGDTVPANGLFHVGSTMMRYPCDTRAPIEEVAGCRCWVTYEVS